MVAKTTDANMRERFDARYERRSPSECWPWTGMVGVDGYPRMKINNRQRRATHVSVYLDHGHWPLPGFSVCHRCDNPRCINPDHLYLGTHHENHRDKKVRKRAINRGCGGYPRFGDGEAAKMLARHDAGESLSTLAESYGVTREAIKYHIRKRRREAA